jgi:hypothetical protein
VPIPFDLLIQLLARSKRSVHLKNEVKSLGLIPIPYSRGVSENFKHRVNRYNTRTVFKMRHTLRNSLLRTRPIRTPQETVNCVNVAEATLEKQKDHWP